MKIEIKCRFTAKVLFECEAGSMKIAVEKAVEARAYLGGADLRGADLRGADLRGANLSGANLGNADLGDADLRGAYLSGANLEGANLGDANLGDASLSGANLRGADLSGANLSETKKDFMGKLAIQKDETAGLYMAVVDGKIDGSCYEGECCCFVGTIAKVKGVHYDSLGIKPNSESPTERLFFGIRRGDTPESNPISGVVKGWIEEFAKEQGISLPVRSVVWG